MHCLEKKDFSLMRIVQMFETKSPSPSGNRVTLAGAAAHQLEVLLGDLEMLPEASDVTNSKIRINEERLYSVFEK